MLFKDFSNYRFAVLLIALNLPLLHLNARKGEVTEHILEEEKGKEVTISPWFTGPLLCPSGHAVPIGYMNIEPYVFVTDIHGSYDSHWKSHSAKHDFVSVNPELPIQIGIAKRMDFFINLQAYYNYTNGAHAVRFGDLQLGFDYQLVNDTPDTWYPGIKLGFKENFPTGKYQKLNPHKKGTDISGNGSFATTLSIVFSRLFHFKSIHFLATRAFFAYSYFAPVHVKGLNAYGGAKNTRGKVYPGNLISTIIGLEYSLTQNWVLALDIANFYANKTRFSGHSGEVSPGIRASNKHPSSDQFSLAPAIEYNFSQSTGIIAGVWFTVAGRNIPEFVSGVIALNYFGSITSKKSKKDFHSHGGHAGDVGIWDRLKDVSSF